MPTRGTASPVHSAGSTTDSSDSKRPDSLRIATRGSRLAMAQTRLVANELTRKCPGLSVEILPLVTKGDRHRGPLSEVGGKGVFTAELEEALRTGQVDIAVHSAKDLPATLPDDMQIIASPERADPRDVLISRKGQSLVELPRGATVGTSSVRRRAQLLRERPDLQIVALRGNIDTRLDKVLNRDELGMDAAVLAMAGLVRAGLAEEHRDRLYPLPLQEFLPAGGQGILAIEGRKGDTAAENLLRCIGDPVAEESLRAERFILRRLEADCHSCVAVHAGRDDGLASVRVMVATRRGEGMREYQMSDESMSEATNRLWAQLERDDARELIGLERIRE